MKRITKCSCLLLVIALLFSLCGCTAMETVNSQAESVLTDISSTTRSTEESTTTTTARPTTTTTAKPTTTTIKPTTTTASAEEPVSETVYITKTGKRWHRDSHCNGGTYYESTLDAAKRRGLTPCKKCAGG